MSLTSDLISDEGGMKTSPSKVGSSSRLRKSPQSSNSIYVPPPLRKRKNSNDIKKNASILSMEKYKVQDAYRTVALHLNSSPSGQINKNKKCENSYMLFGLEDKRNQVKSNEKFSQENDIKDKHSSKSHSSNIKKCDNSYLLFSSVPDLGRTEPQHFPDNNAYDKLWKKQISTKHEGNETYESFSPKNADNLPREKPFESLMVPYLPDDLSCGVGSLSVGNKSIKNTSFPSSAAPNLARDVKTIKQPSLKKCDNSYFLFDDDDSDSKYGKTPYRERPQVQSTLNQSNDWLPQSVSFEKPFQPSMFVGSHISNDAENSKDKGIRTNISSKTNEMLCSEEGEDAQNVKPADVQSTTNISFDGSDSIEDYVIEIYDFPKSLRTQDIMTIFSIYVQDGFFIKWVDDTHALGVFSNPCLVSDVLKKKFDLVSVRALQSATAASIDIASTIPVPSGSRPRTCPSLARRLVSGALGLRVSISDETRQAEKKMLQDAKEERRLAAKQREEAWEGTLRSNLTT